jgi:hypothetical protein
MPRDRTTSLHMVINRTSLSQTVDAVNAAHFDGRALATSERGDVARWIASRQGLPGAYAGTFAGFPSARSKEIVLFTGEPDHVRFCTSLVHRARAERDG